MRLARKGSSGLPGVESLLRKLFPARGVAPPSPIPARVARAARPQPLRPGSPTDKGLAAKALVIEISPHHNGEVFLSKIAVNQNPEFFGFPFTGHTVPKRARNPAYPQRVPDPAVQITIFGRRGVRRVIDQFGLNTVYYATKSEIRITFSQEWLALVPPSSLMVMRLTDEPSLDYELEIHPPGSERYDEYLAACNQTMPSGGARRARRMGWL